MFDFMTYIKFWHFVYISLYKTFIKKIQNKINSSIPTCGSWVITKLKLKSNYAFCLVTLYLILCLV